MAAAPKGSARTHTHIYTQTDGQTDRLDVVRIERQQQKKLPTERKGVQKA